MKKIFALVLSALLLISALPLAVLAADPANLPYITSTSVGFLNYAGTDDATGASPDSAKKTFGTARASGVVGLLQKGGTMVVCGKAYLAADYTLTATSSPILITSNYAGTNYMNDEPADNPSCAFKMKGGKHFTIQTDVILDDIILFQESADPTAFVVDSGATLVIGKGVVNMSKTGKQVGIIVNPGGRLIVGGGNFEIDNQGGEVIENYTYEYSKVSQTAPTPGEDPNADLLKNPPATVFVDYRKGNNANDGTTFLQAKKQMLNLGAKGALTNVAGGGTVVVPGILYIGADYTIPMLGSELLITGSYGGMIFTDPDSTEYASGVIKMATGKVLTIQGNVRFEEIIFFQEGGTQNVVRIADGATVTIGKNVYCRTKQFFDVRVQVDRGGTLILEGESPFESIEGDGIVVMPETGGSFAAKRVYDGRFTDVTAEKWFFSYVKTAYEYELANGTSQTKFSPDSKFTVAQALTAAANIRTAYYGDSVRKAASGEKWYDPYVEYCLQNGIITQGQFANYDKNITRGEMASVFANILPDGEYTAVREGGNPDVTSGMACYAAVQKLYRAGIVGGDAKTGNYRPNDEIIRSEACVIFTRIAAAEYRAK